MHIGKLATCTILRCFCFIFLFKWEIAVDAKPYYCPLYSERKLEQYIGEEGIKTSIVRMPMYNACLILLQLRIIYCLAFK